MELAIGSLNAFQKGEESAIQIKPNNDNGFGNKNNDDLFYQYRGVIINSMITAFGLDRVLFKDREGGNVQTIHNAENHVYSDEKYKERGERGYNRDDYATASYMNKRSKEDFKREPSIVDGYTGKELPKDGRSHLEHIVSAKEIHDNTAFRVLSDKEEMSKVINNEKNTLYTEASANMSKNDLPLQEWMNKPSKKDPSQTNGEHFGIDAEMAYAADSNSRTYIDQTVARKKLEHYAEGMTKDSLMQGGSMAARQALGVIFTEVAMIIMDDTPKLIKKMKNAFSLEVFFEGIVAIVKRAFERVENKQKEIFDAFTNGFWAGIFSSIVTTIINMFLTTAKNIVRLVRQAMVSITEAIKILLFDQEHRPAGQRLAAASKVLFTGASVVLGVILEQTLSQALVNLGVASIPFIGPILVEVVSIFAGVLLTGLLTVTFVYFIEHSQVIKDLVAFLDKVFEDGYDRALNRMKEANQIIDDYIAKLCELDLGALRNTLRNLHSMSDALELGDSNKIYEVCKSLSVELQFNNRAEFVEFMLDKETILEI